MVAGHGRGGSQIGRGGSSTERGGSSTARSAGEKTKAEKIKSDAAHIRGSYRYRNYGVAAPPTFAKRESDRYRRRASSPSAVSSSSSSRQCPSTASVVKMEEDAEPPHLPQPQFAPDDYLDDAELERLLPQLGVNTGLAPSNFVEDRNLDTVVGLISRSSQHDADKADEWRRIAEEQGRVFIFRTQIFRQVLIHIT
jgi:hypothetical protein